MSSNLSMRDGGVTKWPGIILILAGPLSPTPPDGAHSTISIRSLLGQAPSHLGASRNLLPPVTLVCPGSLASLRGLGEQRNAWLRERGGLREKRWFPHRESGIEHRRLLAT